ncbi:TMPIT-domain-containing protein [Gonapodya prolifera JEL478]|uniref:TMPIT-domain-containing protein n=1 Tax=Gonapodya prolifera (strain JEL478) TaxID=1344416 RepID=A0A139A3G8_GONPJ|nr:TMPIT-domain-containing protein [Gonapodya prolifera JEL478]|eukprot:KXS10923.1 TMPIT-domain-containing protein [Gonapodya prolifera JEL478]
MAHQPLAQDFVPSNAAQKGGERGKLTPQKSFSVDDVDKLLADAKGLETATASYKQLEEQVHATETAALKELERLQRDYRALLQVLKRKRKEHKKETVTRRKSIGSGEIEPPGRTSSTRGPYSDVNGGHGAEPKGCLTTDHEDDDLTPITVGETPEAFEETELWLRAEELKKHLDFVARDLPRKPGSILSFALGTPTPVRIRPHSARLSYKSSYESFKLKMTVVSGLFALYSVLFTFSVPEDDLDYTKGNRRFQFKAYRIVDLLYMFVLLYYYSVMTLREHVLVVNGSRIRTWWLMHHVVTIVLIGIMLVWPENRTYSAFRPNFLVYCAYLAFVSYFQFRYQTQRLYTLRALSMAGPMDTTVGEGVAGSASRDVGLLMGLLVIGQAWQVYSGYRALYLWWTVDTATWHVLYCGVIFTVLGVANFVTTVETFLEKTVVDRRKLLSRERHAERGRHLESLRERERSKSRNGRIGEDLSASTGSLGQPLARKGSSDSITRMRAGFGFTELDESGRSRGRA